MDGYKGSISFFCETETELDEWFNHLKNVCVLSNVTNDYLFKKVLGKGSFAKVYHVLRKSDNKDFAIKSIRKSQVRKREINLKLLINEINILKVVNHPNIIKLYEIYESDKHINLVMEYVTGGDLLTQLSEKGSYSEKDLSVIVIKILEVLQYCHSKRIIHRDIKPENVMIMYFYKQ